MTTARKIVVAIVIVVVLLVAFGVTAIIFVLRSGVTRPIDNKFGDQHVKTTVALVELHKTRFGEYPESLSDLRFTGDWDAIALQATDYCTNPDRTAYFVEVRRGWAGKPDLTLPDGFWAGTGYDESLGPCD
jgi:hypothetical protein